MKKIGIVLVSTFLGTYAILSAQTYPPSSVITMPYTRYPSCTIQTCSSTRLQLSSRKDKSGFDFPNPFYSQLHIVQQGEFDFQLVNATGKLVESGKAKEEIKAGQNFSKGLCLLKITHGGTSKVSQVKE